jgi:hypothetical protein
MNYKYLQAYLKKQFIAQRDRDRAYLFVCGKWQGIFLPKR